jgi:hypothetical protein
VASTAFKVSDSLGTNPKEIAKRPSVYSAGKLLACAYPENNIQLSLEAELGGGVGTWMISASAIAAVRVVLVGSYCIKGVTAFS